MPARRLPLFIFAIATTLLFLTAPSHQIDEPIQFTYSGTTGPDKWGSLNPNFSMCVKGKSQSPINIVTSKVVLNESLKPLIRSYGPTNVTLVNNKFNVGVLYPEHSGILTVDNKIYTLKQMHWHAPSEHRIDGQGFVAELHLVHIADDGSVSVVAILYRFGHPDPLLVKIQKKLNELAYEVKKHEDAPITLGPFHPTQVRKRCHKYYHWRKQSIYSGGSRAIKITEVRTISRDQVEALKTPLNIRCKNNARPCQPMNGRHVELYDEDVIVHGKQYHKD